MSGVLTLSHLANIVPASFAHHSIGFEARADTGVPEAVAPLDVGLEDKADVIEDRDRTLAAAGLWADQSAACHRRQSTAACGIA